MVNYLWNTGSTAQSITVWQAGRYVCRVTLPSGPIDSGGVDVTEAFRPRPKIGNPIEYLCEGDEAYLEAPRTFRSYLWNTGETTSSIKVTQGGRYSLTVVDTNGCTGTSDETLVVVVPKPEVRVQGPNSVCPGSPQTYSTVMIPNTTYQWTPDGGTVEAGQGSPVVQVRWNRTGKLSLRAITTRPDGGTCVRDTTVLVTVSARLKPVITYNRRDICEGETLLLVAPTGYTNYRWSTGERTQYITVTTAGKYWLEVQDNSGCTGESDTISVLVFPKPVVSITGPRYLCEGASVTLMAQSEQNNVVAWQWNTGERTSTIRVQQPGTYSVVGTTLDACSDTAYFNVMSQPPIRITIPDVDVGIIPVGYPITANINVRNDGLTDVSVMNIQSSLPATFAPALPRLVSVNTTQPFNVSFTRWQPGLFSIELQWIVMDSECWDTITSRITGTASGDAIVGTVNISTPDTTVPAGSMLVMPVHVEWNIAGQGTFPLTFSISIPENAMIITGIQQCELVEHTIQNGQHHLRIQIPDVSAGAGYVNCGIAGTVLLRNPDRSPVLPHSASVTGGTVAVVYNPGSIAITGCWLPGRLIRIGTLSARVTVYTIAAQEVYSAFHEDITENSIRTIIEGIRLPAQPLLVSLTSSNGQLLWSTVLISD